jgi:hypothetical protein
MGRLGRVRTGLRGAGLAFAAAAIVSGSCSVLVEPGREQCSTDADCRMAGGPFADSVCREKVCRPNPVWACVGSVTWPRPSTSQMATVTLPITDLVNEMPVPGVPARVCRKLDVDCSDPLNIDLKSDDKGRLAVPLPAGFDGYVEIKAPGYMTALYFFYPPVVADREINFLPLLRPEVFNAFVIMSGKPLIPERGHVMLGAYDCQGTPAEGLRFGSTDGDDSTAPFYLVKRFPSVTVTATDGAGRGGIINLPARSVTVTGHNASDRTVSKVSLLLRPGALTYTTMVPTPE